LWLPFVVVVVVGRWFIRRCWVEVVVVVVIAVRRRRRRGGGLGLGPLRVGVVVGVVGE